MEKLLVKMKLAVLGTESLFFFESPRSASPQQNFNFFNPQPLVRNCTFKTRISQPQVRNNVSGILKFSTASLQLFMNRVEEFCNQQCPGVICLELITKHKSKVVTSRKHSKRKVDTFYAIKAIAQDR